MENKEKCKKWYDKNKDKHISNVQARQRETNYASEKTPYQRKIRSIKRSSRYYFPLKNKLCKCGLGATERHHTTKPITRDEFIFVCHGCHSLSL